LFILKFSFHFREETLKILKVMKVPQEHQNIALKAFERDSQSGALGARGTDREDLDETEAGWQEMDHILRNEFHLPFDTKTSVDEFCAAFADGDVAVKRPELLN